jgi:hypothetical protein
MVCGEPRESVRYLRGLFSRPLRVLFEHFGRVCSKTLKYLKGLFECAVKKG